MDDIKIFVKNEKEQHIFNEAKTRLKNIAMACIVNKKPYDMDLQTWIILCLKMYKISD